MGQDPSEIREEIEETRARMGETVEAIGYKTDVKTRVKDSVSEKKDAVVGTVSEKKDAVVGTVRERTPDTEGVRRGARRGVTVAKENPLGLALGGVAVGFLAGLLTPSTRVEDEKMGEVSDELKERAKETGQEALDRGKQVAQEAAETAKERSREQQLDMASSLM
jgi:gas vesicle protein